MDIPAITREYTPGSCRNSRKPMRLSPRSKIRPESPAFRAEEIRVPNQRCKEPRFPWWNGRESQEHCHDKRRTLMSTHKCKIDWCTPNQLKMKHISPSFNPEQSRIPHHIQQVAWQRLQKSRDSLRHKSQVYRNINFSKAKGWKIRALHIVWRWELIPCIRLKR